MAAILVIPSLIEPRKLHADWTGRPMELIGDDPKGFHRQEISNHKARETGNLGRG